MPNFPVSQNQINLAEKQNYMKTKQNNKNLGNYGRSKHYLGSFYCQLKFKQVNTNHNYKLLVDIDTLDPYPLLVPGQCCP